MFYLIFTAEIIITAMILIAMLLLLSGDGAREQKLMVYFLCGSLLHNIGYMLEITATSLDAALVAVKAEYLGSVFVPLLYTSFLFSYCYRKLPEIFTRIMIVMDMVVLVAVFTCNRHSLYYRKVELVQGADSHFYLQIVHGPLYYVFLSCSCLLPLSLSLFILIRTIICSPDHAQGRQYKTITLLSLFPFLALLSYAANLTRGYDPTPAVMGLMLAVVEILIWSRRNYDFRHLAAEVVLQNMSGGVLALDDKKRIVSYNRAAGSIFTGMGEEILGDSVNRIEGFCEEMLEENLNLPFSIGGRYYESRTKKIYSPKGAFEGYAVLVMDVTDTRNYIEEIKRVREQAEQANLAKSEFLANMSHEIRTPMNAITGLSDIIIEESRGQKMYEYARDIKSAAKNLLAIINDILDLSKVEAGKMELVTSDYYVKAAVGEVVGMMDIAASQRGLLMKYEYEPSIPCRYHGDVGRIKQILINLLNNAIKFTQRGYVMISVSGRPGDAENEEVLTFRVKDTGCGIKPEDLTKIFENFKQLDSKKNRAVEGTGLGLSITKKLAELMGGDVTVESEYGSGSTFTVTIPQKIVDRRSLEEVPEVPESETEQMKLFTAAGFKVLLVDDNLVNRKVAKRLLENYQFDLTEAASGPEAIELVKKECYDIIFMDHMMPEMDGIETVQIIRGECGENGLKPVVIALTANAMAGVRERFMGSGFQDFITKPLDRKELNAILAKWIPEEKKVYIEDAEEDAEDELFSEEIQIQGIDSNAIIGRYPQMADYREILELFCMDSKRKIPLLRELIGNKDFANYEIEVHALKSASANIGSVELADLAKEHETAAKRGNEAYVLRNFKELMLRYEKQVEYIRRFLEETAQAPGKTQQAEIDRAELVQKLEKARDQLADFHSKECLAEIEELLCCRLDEETGIRLKEIRGQLRLYEDDNAERLLGELLEDLTAGKREFINM